MELRAARTAAPVSPADCEVWDRVPSVRRAVVDDWLRVLTLPGLLAGGLTGAAVALRMGADPTAIMVTITAVGMAFLGWVQSRIPWRTAWHGADPRSIPTDVLHLILSNGVAGSIVQLATFGLLTGAAVRLAAWTPAGLWPTTLPMSLQVLFALLVGEFAFYWLHHLAHTYDSVWRWHAVHHSSERLTIWSTGRNHPVNGATSYLAQVGPAVLLGASPEVLLFTAVWTTLHGLLQHANIDLRTGPLHHVLATADLHRWHHSTVPAEGHTNYGSNLIVWDKLFGTWQAPPPEGPAEVGVVDTILPRSFWGHIIAPFRWQALPRPDQDAAADLNQAAPTHRRRPPQP